MYFSLSQESLYYTTILGVFQCTILGLLSACIILSDRNAGSPANHRPDGLARQLANWRAGWASLAAQNLHLRNHPTEKPPALVAVQPANPVCSRD